MKSYYNLKTSGYNRTGWLGVNNNNSNNNNNNNNNNKLLISLKI